MYATKKVSDVGFSGNAVGLLGVEAGYHNIQNANIEHTYEKGFYSDGNIFRFKQNDNGDDIFTVMSLSAYFIVGGEINLDVNVSKLKGFLNDTIRGCSSTE